MKTGGLGINYKEPYVGKYKSVRAHVVDVEAAKEQRKTFNTGDVVVDFENACKWLQDNGIECCSMSSDVDHFLMDDKKDVYYWDNEVGMIRRTKDKAKNILENHKLRLKLLKEQKKLIEDQIGLMERMVATAESLTPIELVELDEQAKRNELGGKNEMENGNRMRESTRT